MVNGKSHVGISVVFLNAFSSPELLSNIFLVTSLATPDNTRKRSTAILAKMAGYLRLFDECFDEAFDAIINYYYEKYGDSLSYEKSDYKLSFSINEKLDDISFRVTVIIIHKGIVTRKTDSEEIISYMEPISYIILLRVFIIEDVDKKKAEKVLFFVLDKYFFPIIEIIERKTLSKIGDLKPLYMGTEEDILDETSISFVFDRKIRDAKSLVVLDDYSVLYWNRNGNNLKLRAKIYGVSEHFCEYTENPVERAILDYLEIMYALYHCLRYWVHVGHYYHSEMLPTAYTTYLRYKLKSHKAVESKRLSERLKNLRAFLYELFDVISDLNEILQSMKLFIKITLEPKRNNILALLNMEVDDPFLRDWSNDIVRMWEHISNELRIIVENVDKLYASVSKEISFLQQEYSRMLLRIRLTLALVASNIPTGIAIVLNGINFIYAGMAPMGFILIAVGLAIIIVSVGVMCERWFGGL